MSEKWRVVVYVWPLSGIEEKWVGGREQNFCIIAKDFDDAVVKANHILIGIRTNPDVWQAGISGVMVMNR